MNKIKLTTLPLMGVIITSFFTSLGVSATDVIDRTYQLETAGGVCSEVKRQKTPWNYQYNDDAVIRYYSNPGSLYASRDNYGTARVYCPVPLKLNKGNHVASVRVKLDRGSYPKGNTVCKLNYMGYYHTPITAAYGSALKKDTNKQNIYIKTPDFLISSTGFPKFKNVYLQCSLQPGERMFSYQIQYDTLGE